MVCVNNNLDEDIKEFGVLIVRHGRLMPCPEITSKNDYVHGFYDLHHYIKAQDYRRNRRWYEENKLRQVLILLPRKMHTHLESPIYGLSETKFWEVYRIRKKDLLFNKKQWIQEQVERKEL